MVFRLKDVVKKGLQGSCGGRTDHLAMLFKNIKTKKQFLYPHQVYHGCSGW